MKYERTVTVDYIQYDNVETWLALNAPAFDDKDGMLESWTTSFPNGWTVDLNVYDTPSGPYMDVVLFDDDSVERGAEPVHTLDGETTFESDGDEYLIRVARGASK